MDFKEFLKEAEWNGSGATAVDSRDNYIGPDHSGWLCGPMVNRDSKYLEQSNYETALEMLGGEQDGVVEVEACSHWACGWFNRILVKANSDKAKVLFEIHQSLQDYPILDESDYHEREQEYQNEMFSQYKQDFERTICDVLGLEYTDHCLEMDLERLASALYSDACGYYGSEEAFVYDHSMASYTCEYNLLDMAKSRNPYAILLHRTLFQSESN